MTIETILGCSVLRGIHEDLLLLECVPKIAEVFWSFEEKEDLIRRMKHKIVQVVERLYTRVFGHPMGSTMRYFLKSLSFSLIGGGLSSLIAFVLSIFMGRLLGPDQYGKYSLVLALAQIIILIMMLGIDASTIRAISMKNTETYRKQITVTAAFTLLFTGTISTFFLLLFSQSISRLFQLDLTLLRVAIFFTAILSLKTFFDSLLRGWQLFSYQALVRLVETLVVVVTFFTLYYYFQDKTYIGYIYALVVGSLVAIFFVLWRLRSYFSRWRDTRRDIASQLWQYSRFALLSGLGGILVGSLDKVIISHLVGIHELGIYSAYYTVSVMVAIQFGSLLFNVLFPIVVEQDDKAGIIKKVDSIARVSFMPVCIFLLLLTYVAIRIFGSQFTLNIPLLILMAIYATATFWITLYWWLINTTGVSGIAFTAKNGIIGGCLYLMGLFVAVPIFGIVGIPVSYLLFILYAYKVIREWKRQFFINQGV